MSDLLSTPSQSQSTVSNEAFEALIDLLASDGVDENPSNLPVDGTRSPPNTLRDPSGKLDFDKIRLMFAAQNATSRVSTATEPLAKSRIQSLAAPREDGDSDDEHHSHQSSSTNPSRSNSISPKPVDRAPAGHRRSSTFGNQPWTPIHQNATAARVEVVAPVLSRQPLSFDELNAALTGAREEVKSLRQQYDQLQALVSKRFGTETRDLGVKLSLGAMDEKKVAPCKENGHVQPCSASSQAPAPQPSDLPVEIATLSGDEAKRALSTLVQTLNLSLSTVRSMASSSTATTPISPQPNLFPPSLTRQHDVASIARALKFLGTVDELVWRRSSAPSGPRTLLPVFSEENIIALLARLELWERAVRRSPRV